MPFAWFSAIATAIPAGIWYLILLVAVILGVAAFGPVALRLYGLMVRSHAYYAERALRNQTRTTAVAAARGAIYDRNMQLLAGSVTVETVYLDPRELKQAKVDIPAMAQTLARILDLDAQWIEEHGSSDLPEAQALRDRIGELFRRAEGTMN